MTDKAEVRAGVTGPLFVLTILTGSFLLFLVQPMIARMALPRLGGAPAVWNSAMLVYQALLLGGYAYAHALGRVRPVAQAGIHLLVLGVALCTLPIGLRPMELPVDAVPALWVPWLLGLSIGPLFFAVSAQAPLLQRWYGIASGGRDPYALYAASNFGSFAGLIAYPLLAEPMLTLHAQSLVWTSGYVLLVGLVALCTLPLLRLRIGQAHVRHTSQAPSRRRWSYWILLAFIPSGLMLATSTFLTTDIVAVPLLWVLPLGLYLLSFTLAFSPNRLAADLAHRFAPVMVLLCGAILVAGNGRMVWINAGIALSLLFVVATSLHARMYDLRPAPDRLTGFYLAMSLGGALGGVFAGLIAPVLFDWTYEFPLLVFAAAPLLPQQYLFPGIARLWGGDARRRRIKTLAFALGVLVALWVGIGNPDGLFGDKPESFGYAAIALLGVLAMGRRVPFVIATAGALLVFGGFQSIQFSLSGARTRSYFGVYTVRDYANARQLAHGTTVHGIQLKGPQATLPTSYYAPGSGIGQAMQRLPGLFGANPRVGIVGLGAGTLACYARPSQHWRFYEIDPAVVRIARDSGKFSFLARCLPHADIVIGDARLRLAGEPDASRDLLVLDAFSSDAVPMHLLTREAFATYGRVLAPAGLLMVHISNNFMALQPVVAGSAAGGGWHMAILRFTPTPAQMNLQASASDWVALSRDAATMQRLINGDPRWRPLRTVRGFVPWSDDFASILPVLRILHPALDGRRD